MAEDREVLREVWQGRVPAAFVLSEDDADAMSQPEPYYLMLPRLCYLSVVLDKLKKHFGRFLPQDKQEVGIGDIWLDFEGAPLKWHLPTGVLFDQISMAGPEPAQLPWSLTVHFGSFPDQDILRCASKEAMETHFMSCIKEADQLKHGGKTMASMQKKDHNQLWQGLQNDKFDQFWAVNRKLMDSGGGGGGGGGGGSFKHIPFRLYQADRLTRQKLVKPTKRAEEHSEDSSSDTESATAAGKRQSTLRDFLEEMVADRPCGEVKVLLQGISPDLDTPLQWMSEHLSYPDNFLHIVVG